MRKTYILALAILLTISLEAQTQIERITAADAKRFVGSTRTVCGKVVSATYANRSRGKPTFLNLDKPYPNQIFTIVIWGEHRDKFDTAPETKYRDKDVCVSGLIEVHREVPQIVVSEPKQIQVPAGVELAR